MTVSKRWLLTSVGGSYTNTIMLNPARPEFGKWIRQIALAYDFYSVKSLKIEYIPTCSVTTPGSLAYYIEFDPNDELP
jgi:hypothetical protein